MRDYGLRQEEVKLDDLTDLKDFLNKQKDYWLAKQKEVEERFLEVDKEDHDPVHIAPKPKKRKRTTKDIQPKKADSYARFAAELQSLFFAKVCCDWRENALTMRERVFEQHEEQLIDIHDVKTGVKSGDFF